MHQVREICPWGASILFWQLTDDARAILAALTSSFAICPFRPESSPVPGESVEEGSPASTCALVE